MKVGEDKREKRSRKWTTDHAHHKQKKRNELLIILWLLSIVKNKIRFKRNKNFTYNANEILLSKSGHLKPKLIRAP